MQPTQSPSGLQGSIRITFCLDIVTQTLNRTLRCHWQKRERNKRELAWKIRQAYGPLPLKPIERAHVLIERYGRGLPDPDGLVGGMKDLIDCLISQGTPFLVKGEWKVPHPCGLGLILNDDPAHMTLEAKAYRVRRGEHPRTVVTITEIA